MGYCPITPYHKSFLCYFLGFSAFHNLLSHHAPPYVLYPLLCWCSPKISSLDLEVWYFSVQLLELLLRSSNLGQVGFVFLLGNHLSLVIHPRTWRPDWKSPSAPWQFHRDTEKQASAADSLFLLLCCIFTAVKVPKQKRPPHQVWHSPGLCQMFYKKWKTRCETYKPCPAKRQTAPWRPIGGFVMWNYMDGWVCDAVSVTRNMWKWCPMSDCTRTNRQCI